MRIHDSVRTTLWNTMAAFLVLAVPLVTFLRYHHYPLHQTETFVVFGLVAMAALFWGLLMTLGRTAGRVAVITFLCVLAVDVQTEWITTLGLRLLLNVLFFGVLAWFFRRRLAVIACGAAGAAVLASLVTPAAPLVTRTGLPFEDPTTDPDLPFVLHLILDEQMGIEGLPREFDPDRTLAHRIRDDYLDRGFRVFGRTYSRYYSTSFSIPGLLNFKVADRNDEFFSGRGFARGRRLESNAWFEWLQDAGYRVHVIESDYIRYFREPGEDQSRLGHTRATFPGETLAYLAPLDIPAGDKARTILGTYVRRSFFLKMFRDGYADVRRSDMGRSLGLPDWDESGRHLSVLASMEALDILEGDMAAAGPGRAFFAHLLVPHFPYAFRSDCSVRPMDGAWLDVWDLSLAPRRNDTTSRALRYPLYLEQLECTHTRIMDLVETWSSRDWWDDALVVIHGDHGSRLDRGPPQAGIVEMMTGEDFLDAYATFFAVKRSGLRVEYDRRQLPIDHVFEKVVRDGVDSGDPELERRPFVLVRDGQRAKIPWSLPFFEYGLPDTTVPVRLDP